jgi:hypothetical protein
MTNWYYYDGNGSKIGPINSTTLKTLVQQGLITADTTIENGQRYSRKAGELRSLDFSGMTIYNTANSATPASTIRLQHNKFPQYNHFQTEPSLKCFFDFKFNLCCVFKFTKRLIQIIYVLCFILCVVCLLVGPVINFVLIWHYYREGQEKIKPLEHLQQSLKNEQERPQPQTDNIDDISFLKRTYPSFTFTLFEILLVTIIIWIGNILMIIFVRLLSEFIIFMLDWCIDTRLAAQYTIANNQHTT